MNNCTLENIRKQMLYYKSLGDNTLSKIKEEDFFWKYNECSNSIATLIKHLSGNMLSRWTDFMNTDGEKEWRNRTEEFENTITNRQELIDKWEKGWNCFFNALENIKNEDLEKEILISNQKIILNDAINKQVAHYPYHVGQIVFIGKMICNCDYN
ncbi:MAG: DUF1572 family protein [Flavobacteriales bacterium]|nr:DUF1572 family protein [Flavobacteriales bacterium]